MATKDLDVEQLAGYLHLAVDKVIKLAERGKIPGRKIGGVWRFPEAEIHHWLEDRIGVSDSLELGDVQRVIDRMPSHHPGSDRFEDLLPIEAIAVPLAARTRGSVIRDMCELAAQTGYLWDSAGMAEQVLAREDLHPTALESGVAMLHPRRPQPSMLSDSVLALGITTAPLHFGNQSGRQTDIFFLICSFDDRIHLRILAKLSRLVHDDQIIDRLRHCSSSAEARAIVLEAEAAWGV